MRNELEITDSIQILIDRRHAVCHADVISEDLNTTYPNDPHELNMRTPRRSKAPNLVGCYVQIGDGSHISNCVIGDGAVVESGTTLDRCLLLEKAIARPGRKLPECGCLERLDTSNAGPEWVIEEP